VTLLATTACPPPGRRPVLRPTATLLATTEATTSGKSSPIPGMPTTVDLDVDARWRDAGLSDDAGWRREVQLATISMRLHRDASGDAVMQAWRLGSPGQAGRRVRRRP
jgi:hypothetical protein